MRENDARSLFGAAGPLPGLAGLAFLFCASSRFSHALVAGAALVLTYAASAPLCRIAAEASPGRASRFLAVPISTFVAAVFALALSLASPALAAQTGWSVACAPAVFSASGFVRRTEDRELAALPGAGALEALFLFLAAAALALIREPFGFGTLTLPSLSGAVAVLGSDSSSFASARLLSTSVGSLALCGYALAFALKLVRDGGGEGDGR